MGILEKLLTDINGLTLININLPNTEVTWNTTRHRNELELRARRNQ